jgi:polysaccharide export outer membrane protein
MIQSVRWLTLLSVLTLIGCTEPRLMDTGRVGIVSAETLPPPTLTDLVSGPRPHLIGPFDRVAVDVLGLGDISRQVQADANGQISLPLAGTIDVNGKTPEQVARLVEERLRQNYVRDPRVTVSIVETVSQTVTVDGQVKMPGVYPVVGQMTLMRAIARAQGTTEYASTSHVVVFRTVEGRPMAALYDLRAIRLAAYADPQIYPNDVVVVSESEARRIFPQILQGAALLLTPAVAFINR